MARPKSGYFVDGKPVPGVTTICGMLNKPALLGWGAKVCTELAWEAGRTGLDMPKWTELLYPVKDAAADAGTLCHELFEHRIRTGADPEQPPPTEIGAKAWNAYLNARHWLESSRLKVTAHEKPLVSAVWGFGGTPDALAESEDEARVYGAEWKTSAGIYPEMLVQHAAYRVLWREEEGINVEGLHLVRFSRDDGDFKHAFFDGGALDAGWEIFRRLLEIYPTLKDLEKRVK
jgi:hypothetical protein